MTTDKRLDSYGVFTELELYKKQLAKLNDERDKLDEAWSAASKYAEDENLPRDKWDEAEAAADEACKAYKTCEEKIDAIENILRLLRELNDELEFLETGF